MHPPNGFANPTPPYRGRFAPSPTGKLHLGSLTTALASCLQARQNHGEWLIRIENIDPPREVAGSASEILHNLERHGFAWDHAILYQKDRSKAYEEALDKLLAYGLAYPCGCTRQDMAIGRDGQPFYPGTCRKGLPKGKKARSIRLRTHDHPIQFIDAVQGHYAQRIESATGDFVIRRSDGWYAYQLAVVVDDAWQEITEVVRGIDLIDSTPRQLHLYACLQLAPPKYAHIPIVVNSEGSKLGKSTNAEALDPRYPGENLWRALQLLQQKPPAALRHADPVTLWEWAENHWSLAALKSLQETVYQEESANSQG